MKRLEEFPVEMLALTFVDVDPSVFLVVLFNSG